MKADGSRGQKLTSNTVLFGLGMAGTQVIGFVMLPFYTHWLTPAQFGAIEMVNLSIALMLPLLTLSVSEAVFRFSMADGDRAEAFSIGVYTTTLFGIPVACAIALLVPNAFVQQYRALILALFLLQAVQALLGAFARATNAVKLFAISGVIQAAFLAGTNFVALGLLAAGVQGYLIGLAISYFAACVVLVIGTRAWAYLRLRVSHLVSAQMLRYSVFLIPNLVIWWALSSFGRFVLSTSWGLAAVGQYGVALRLPTLLAMLTIVFSQAWQISAIEQYGQGSPAFYYKVYQAYSAVLLLGISIVLIISQPLVQALTADSYREAWRYVPFPLLSVLFSSLASFLGATYLASKRTRGALTTSVVAAAVGILLNLGLVPRMGPQGAAFALAASFLVLWLLRLWDTRHATGLKIWDSRIAISLIVYLFQAYLLLHYVGVWSAGAQALLVLAQVVLNRRWLVAAWGVVWGMARRRPTYGGA